MTQEDKELLLKDLCARLLYGVKCYPVITNGEPNTIGGYCEILDDFYIREVGGWFNISMIKPYLRSMSSMTEEETEEYFSIQTGSIRGDMSAKIDFYIKHHFDFRLTTEGLSMIEAGLALEAPEGMYDIKEE